jgi:hypothetical protein
MHRAGLLLLAACACTGADAMTVAPAPVSKVALAPSSELGLSPGETMMFEVRIAGILAGEAQLAVGEIGDYEGHRAVVVKSHAATAGAVALVKHVVDDATTVIDTQSGLPLALDTLVEQGDTRTTATAKFAGSRAEITYVRSDEKAPRTFKLDFGNITVHDSHSAMAQLRGWRATAGATRSVFIVGGRRVWRVDVTYGGPDTIASPIGNRHALRFTGQAFRTNRDLGPEAGKPARTFSVWLSDDADRVPLKLTATTELGDIAMDLTEYSR